MMTEAAKAARRAYKADWARKNPEKVKAQQERYWAKRAAEAAKCEHTGAANCRGCKYSRDPALFDGGCQYPQPTAEDPQT